MSLVVAITFLFIVSAVTPMVVGYNARTTEHDKDLEDLAFYCYHDYNPLKFEFYKERCKRETLNDIVESKEVTIPVGSIQADLGGPMDSPWPMKCHDTHHTSRSPYSTANNNGVEKWRFEIDWWGVDGGAVIDNDGIIYFGERGQYLYAIYPNGTLKWKFNTGNWIWSTPAIAEDGTIYVGSWDDYLHAIYPNGTLKWKFCAYDNIASSPAIADDGTIYFGTMGTGYKIYAVNPNGTEKWHYTTGYKIVSDPAIGDDGTVYIGSGDTYLYALYPNGTLRWRFKTGDWIKAHPSIADDGTIYISSFDGYLYALYPNNGTLKWKYGGGGDEASAAIGEDGTIYLGNDRLRAIYPNGTEKWSVDLGPNIDHASPAISADGTIYVGAGTYIIAVDLNGTEKWRKRIANKWVESSPSIAEDGTVYIGSSYEMGAGYLHAFGTEDFEADAHGPYYGIVDEPVQFNGSATGRYPPYRWHWDFGDEGTSEKQNPLHEYQNPSNYTVVLTVTDSGNNETNDTTWALIQESNSPPNKPTIDGMTRGKAGEEYDYTFKAIDPDDNNVWYWIEWGDGEKEEWIGPFKSGEEIIRSHTWEERDTYTIKAKAKDPFDAEGPWGELEIEMPISHNSLFLRFLERFPQAFPILRYLLGM